jgi:hypothetical protein
VTAESDSLAYQQLRESVLAADSGANAPFVETADALADESLYAEAYEVLQALTASAEPAESTPVAKTGTPGNRRWHFSCGVSWYDYRDTASLQDQTRDERALDTLLRSQLTAFSTIRSDWYPFAGSAFRVGRQLYLSESRASVSLSPAIHLFREQLRLESSIRAEKALDTMAFGKSPSDMVGAGLAVTAGSRPGFDALAWRVPASMRLERYRTSLRGRESMLEILSTPSLSWRNEALSLDLICDVRLSDFDTVSWTRIDTTRRPLLGLPARLDTVTLHNDSSDLFSLRPEITLSAKEGALSARTALSLLQEHYYHGARPSIRREWSARLRAAWNPAIDYSMGFRILYDKLTETHREVMSITEPTRDTSYISDTSYTIAGYRLRTRPSVEFPLITSLSMELGCLLERRRYPLIPLGEQVRSAGESLIAFEPEVLLFAEHQRIAARGLIGFRLEWPDDHTVARRGENRSLHLAADGTLNLANGLGVYGSFASLHRFFRENATRNLSFAAGLSISR